jgi:hypothetical protein
VRRNLRAAPAPLGALLGGRAAPCGGGEALWRKERAPRAQGRRDGCCVSVREARWALTLA